MTDFPISNLDPHIAAVKAYADEAILRQAASQASVNERLQELEVSFREAYLKDPVFHRQVHLGAQVIDHMFPGVSRGEALRAALLVLAAGRNLG